MSDRPTKRKSRLKELLKFDAKLLKQLNADRGEAPFFGLIGIDEVGRGSLVGPVVAAALAFPSTACKQDFDTVLSLDDSKAPHFNHEKRLALAECLKAFSYWGIGEASQAEIETLNIAQASLLASHRAVEQLLSRHPDCDPDSFVLVMDGKLKIKSLSMHQVTQVSGDKLSAAVAGASILAKAHRDAMMIDLAEQYPGYHWETNAGYATPAHLKAIEELGVCPLHRKTFKYVYEAMARQQPLLPC